MCVKLILVYLCAFVGSIIAYGLQIFNVHRLPHNGHTAITYHSQNIKFNVCYIQKTHCIICLACVTHDDM